MHLPRLLFIPLDDRPVCLDVVVRLAQAAGIDVRTPDPALLGDRHRPGNVEGIWTWLEGETAVGGANALIASAEMVCFGGLVGSRKSTVSFEEITPWLRRLGGTARRLPTHRPAGSPPTPPH